MIFLELFLNCIGRQVDLPKPLGLFWKKKGLDHEEVDRYGPIRSIGLLSDGRGEARRLNPRLVVGLVG